MRYLATVSLLFTTASSWSRTLMKISGPKSIAFAAGGASEAKPESRAIKMAARRFTKPDHYTRFFRRATAKNVRHDLRNDVRMKPVKMKFHSLLSLALLAGSVCRADLAADVLAEINRARENPAA